MMLALFRLLGRGLKALGASLALIFARARDWRKYSARLRWPLHFLLIALILAALAFLNYYFDLERILRTPWPILRKVWLPLLFLLVYVNVWLGRWLWQLLGPEKEFSEFPDVDAAWNKAMQALDRAGIELSSAPLFLVLGRADGSENGLFQAARLGFTVQQAPAAAAPLHVWANAASIWVTCPLSALDNRQAAKDKADNEPQTTDNGERLAHLCRSIVRDRLPYCPVNGVLLLLPLAATNDERAANQIGAVCERDLRIVEDVLQVRCPLATLVCDLEQATGFRDFIARFPQENLGRRLGRSFSYPPEVDRPSLPRIVEDGVEWIGEGLMLPLMYRLLHLGKGSEDRGAAIQGNRRLYQFLHELLRRQPHLSRLLLRAAVRPESSLWLHGCYLAATGANPDSEQAFVADVFRHIIDGQNFVSWTANALAEERAYRRLVRFGYVCLAVFALAVCALGYTLG